jgi:hypothetical protein
MPNAFGKVNVEDYGWQIVAVLVVLAVIVVVGYTIWPSASAKDACPARLHRSEDGSLTLEPSGQKFPDMNAFQKWWHASRDYANCPLPLLTGATRERAVMREEASDEQTYAKTPIYKVDDYEFSRVFGYERNGHMDVPRENYNIILNQRAFDWPDKPLSSDERRAKYNGLHEGFTAAGDLKSMVLAEPSAEDLVKEAVSRYGEKRHKRSEAEEDLDCHVSREAREVADMVAKAYESDPNYEPVITKVGANHWEVNELKPRRRHEAYAEQGNDKVVDTGNDAVDIQFQYREQKVNEQAIDPFFLSTGDLPYQSERQSRDPWYGPVPGMERMFGPTFDHKKWY